MKIIPIINRLRIAPAERSWMGGFCAVIFWSIVLLAGPVGITGDFALAQSSRPPAENILLQNKRFRERVNWSEGFESPGVSWRYLYRDNQAEVVSHSRTPDANSGKLAETLVVEFPQGDCVVLGHYFDYPMIYEELSPSLWLRADQPGITLGALVVLPRTIRPDTQTPLTVIIKGESYSQIGDWQKLTFPQRLKRPLQRVIQAIRSERKLVIDPEGAYVRQLIVLVEGHAPSCRISIDDIEVEEHLPCSNRVLALSEKKAIFNPVNLLSFRLASAEVSLFPDNEQEISFWGNEPFDLPADSKSALRPSVGSNSPYQKTIQRLFDDVFGPENNGSGTKTATNAQAIPATIPQPGETIGSVDYRRPVEGEGTGSVFAAGYSVTDSTAGITSVISGSGTVADTKDAKAWNVSLTQSVFPETIKFQGPYLTVGKNLSYSVRAIEYQFEPLLKLKELGFNAVWLRSPPTAELLQEASDVDIWLISPPPVGSETVNKQSGGQAPGSTAGSAGVPDYFNNAQVGSDYDPVLLWDLGRERRRTDINDFRAAVTKIKGLDKRFRPIVCHINNGLSEYTFPSNADLILMSKPPVLTSLDFVDYGRWLRSYPGLALPEFPFWNEIQTQPDSRLLAQSRFFGATEEMPAMVSYEQIRQQVRLSMGAGCHGLLFASESPLTGLDHETQYRACALELINLELLLTDPWFGGGAADDIINSSSRFISAIMLRNERTGLVSPISTAPNNQFVMVPGATDTLTFVAPVREGYTADELLPGNLRQIPSHRCAGGISVEINDAGMNSLVFLTQSQWHSQVIAENAPKFGSRMAELAIRLTKMRLDIYETTILQLTQINETASSTGRKKVLDIPEQTSSLTQTRREIAQAEQYFIEKDFSAAYLQAERAGREIRKSERILWENATRFEMNRPVVPLSVSFGTLPAYLQFYQKINAGEIKLTGDNRIIGGDMEDVAAWNSGNWMRFESKTPGVNVSVLRDPGSARTGSFGLRIAANSANSPESGSTGLMEDFPVWLEIPIPVRAGELICIHGNIRIPKAITNSVDGMMIYDDHGGPALALRFTGETPWRSFAFYRYAVFDGEMKIIFSMNGFGEAWLDDLGAHAIQ